MRVGVRSTTDLASTDPNVLLQRMDDFNARHMIRIAPIDVTLDVATRWIEAAKSRVLVVA